MLELLCSKGTRRSDHFLKKKKEQRRSHRRNLEMQQQQQQQQAPYPQSGAMQSSSQGVRTSPTAAGGQYYQGSQAQPAQQYGQYAQPVADPRYAGASIQQGYKK